MENKKLKTGKKPSGNARQAIAFRLLPQTVSKVEQIRNLPQFEGNRRVVVEAALEMLFSELESA